MLGYGRGDRGDGGRDQRQGIIGAEQLVGRGRDRKQPFHLGASRQEEDGGDAEPGDKQQERIGNERGKPHRGAIVERNQRAHGGSPG